MTSIRRLGGPWSRVLLHALPCGCVIDRYETPFYQIEDAHGEVVGFIECPWCETTYDGDLVSYVEHVPVPHVYLPRPVVTDGTHTLEVLGACDDGHLFVRRGPGWVVEHCLRRVLPMHN